MKSIFKRGLLLLAFILGLAFHLAAQSTQMTIHFNDGTEHSYYMSENDRVYFEDNETLVVELAPTKSDRFNLADIRKITCAETEGVSEASNASVQLFPNPSHNAFLLRNLNERQIVSIYALDGRIMKSFETTGDQWIDISDLPIAFIPLNPRSSKTAQANATRTAMRSHARISRTSACITSADKSTPTRNSATAW